MPFSLVPISLVSARRNNLQSLRPLLKLNIVLLSLLLLKLFGYASCFKIWISLSWLQQGCCVTMSVPLTSQQILSNKCCKHIAIDYQLIPESVAHGDLVVCYVPSLVSGYLLNGCLLVSFLFLKPTRPSVQLPYRLRRCNSR